MKKLFKIPLSIISGLVLMVLPCNTTRSCGPSLPEEADRFMLFQPDISGLPELSPFYYNQDFVGGFYSDEAGKDYHRNCAEWRNVVNNAATEEDIYALQYNTEPDVFLYAANNANWDGFDDNSFVKWLLKPENKEAMRYFAFAKQVEFYQFNNTDPWDSGNNVPRPLDSLTSVALKGCETASSSFLKERYAFQALKLAYYCDSSTIGEATVARVLAGYDKHLATSRSIVADWALLYRGLMVTDDVIKRTLFLVQAFDRSEEKKGYVHQFLPTENLLLLEKTVTDAHTLAIIHALQGIKNPGRALENIKQVYKYEPSSKYLPMLICREVNKLEDWLLSPEVLGFNSGIKESIYASEKYNDPNYSTDTSYDYFAQKNIEKDKAYLQEVAEYFKDMLQAGKGNESLLQLSIAHLYHVEGNFKAAKKILKSIGPLTDTIFRQQREIEETVSLIYTGNISKAKTQQALFEQFSKLKGLGLGPKEVKDEDYYWDYPKDAVSQLYLLLSKRYKQKGDIVLASLTFLKANVIVNGYYGYDTGDSLDNYGKIAYLDKFGTPEDVDALMKFRHGNNKTPFESSLQPKFWASDNMYLDVKGTIFVRQGKFREALAVMEKMPDDFWSTTYEFASYLPKTHISNVGTLLPVTSGPEDKYSIPSKKLVLRDIVALQDSLKNARKADKAAIYFLLANAYYNITYNGKAWMMYSYGKTSREEYGGEDDWAFYSFYPNSVKHGETYYRCSDAVAMYQKALASAGDDKELAAKSLLMLSLCDDIRRDQANYSYRYVKGIYTSREPDTSYSKYLDVLSSRYAGTNVFELAATECPDIESYLSSAR